MAGDGITIPINAAVDQFSAAIKSGVISPLDNVQEAMDKITAASNAAGGNGFAEGMVAAQKATDAESESLDKIKGNLSEYQSASHTAAVAVKSDTEGTTEAFDVSGTEQKRISREVTDEVGKNSRNMASNFAQGVAGMTGSLGDIATTAETAAQQIAFLGGPEVAIPAAAAAAVIGLIQAALSNSAQSAADLQKHAADLAQALLGTSAGVDALDTGIRAWVKDSSDIGISLTDLKKLTDDSKSSFGSYAEAIATKSVPAMKALKAANDEQIASLAKQVQSVDETTAGSKSNAASNLTQSSSLQKLNSVLSDNIKANQQAEEVLKAVAQANDETVAQYKAQEAASTAAKTATADLASTVKSSMSDAATDTSDWASSTKVDLTQISTNLAEAQALWERIPQDVQTLTKAGLTNAGLEYIESLPNGEQIIDAMAVNPGQWATLIAQFNTQGTQGASAYTRAINGAMPKTIPGPRVVVGAPDLSAVIAGIKTVTGQTYTLKFQGVNTNGVRVP